MAVSKILKKERYSNADVAHLVMEVHSCLHTVENKVDGIVSDVGHVKERVAKIEGYQEGVANKFNLPTAPAPDNFLKRHKTPLLSAGAAFGGVASFVAAYPLLRVLFLALDAYLVKSGAK